MLPEWPEALRPRTRQADDLPPAEPGQIALETLRDALMAIPNGASNPNAHARDWWLTIGAALHYETGGSTEGLELWLNWSAQWPGHDPDHAESTWKSFRRRDGALRTGATILAEAEKHGWHDLERIFALYDTIPVFEEAERPEAESGGLTFLSPADCTTATARKYVVKGLVAEGDVAAIVGAPGVGKSLIAPRLGYAVAQGRPVFGLKVRQGGVLYVAAEDETGMRARVAALREEYGDAPDFTLVGGVTSLFPDGDHKALRAAVKARRPALIVIDTLAMAFPGLRENEAESMGLVVAAARALTKWGAAVVLVHHDTKDGTQGLPRGHSILNGALDMSLHLTRDVDLVRGRPTKNRNGSADIDLAFTIATRVLGEDEDGDEIRAAFARDLEPGEVDAKPVRLAPSAKVALDIFHELAGDSGAVLVEAWRQACIESPKVNASDKPDSRRAAFRRAFEMLTRTNRLVESEGKIRLARTTRSDFPDSFGDEGGAGDGTQ
jgi:RecA-family ATPase